MSTYLNLKELKEQASLVELLRQLGFSPAKKAGEEYYYISMLRDSDTRPSFCVNDELGVWFDHGLGKGGNIIDFGIAYWPEMKFNEVIVRLHEAYGIILPEQKSVRPRKPVKIPHYVIEEIKDIGTHPAITGYLKGRGIFTVAENRLSEVYYYVEDQKGMRKQFFAAGWKNESGGWEIRNKYFKGCLGHKAISFIPGLEKQVVVFEGYINYLSWLMDNPGSAQSAIILNTLALLNAGIGKARLFSTIDLFLDRDISGNQASKEFIQALPYATDRSSYYEGFNDYNDKLVDTLKIRTIGR